MSQLDLIKKINSAKKHIEQREQNLLELCMDKSSIPAAFRTSELEKQIEFEKICLAELRESVVIWQALLIVEMKKELDSVKCLLWEVADCAGVEICEEHWCKEPCPEC